MALDSEFIWFMTGTINNKPSKVLQQWSAECLLASLEELGSWSYLWESHSATLIKQFSTGSQEKWSNYKQRGQK